MATLIVYATKHGCTEKSAQSLTEKLIDKVEITNLKEKKVIDLAKYEKVIIGGSIYMGKVQKEVRQFCENNKKQLQEKDLGIFICCMREGEIAESQLETSFPQEIYAAAAVRGVFGGEFILGNMNFIERLIVKKVAKVEKDESTVSEEEISKFAEFMNNV